MNTHQNTNNTIDPAKVKPGDTVTLEAGTATVHDTIEEIRHDEAGRLIFQAPPTGRFSSRIYIIDNANGWTLTAHQPAPEPEPEWRPGTVLLGTMSSGTDERFFVTDGGALAIVNDEGEQYWPENLMNVREAVVIDPAKVDVDAIARHLSATVIGPPAAWPSAVRAVLAKLGIEAS